MARKTKDQIQADLLAQHQIDFDVFKAEYNQRLVMMVMFYSAWMDKTLKVSINEADSNYLDFFVGKENRIATLPIDSKLIVDFNMMYDLEEVELQVSRYHKEIEEQKEQQQKFNVAWNKLTAEERQLLGIRNA